MSASDSIIGWPQNAYVGQKVVCVDNFSSLINERVRWGSGGVPEIGKAYTITRVYVGPNDVTCFWLAEISRSAETQRQWGGTAGYGAWRFRPLIARDTDAAASRGVEKLKRDVLRQPVGVGA